MEQESVSSLRGVADDEVIHSYTCIFWIATNIFDFLAIDKCMCHTELVLGSIFYKYSKG